MLKRGLLSHDESVRRRCEATNLLKEATALHLRRSAAIAGPILLALLIVLGGLVTAFVLNFHVSAPIADYPVPGSALEAQRQDLDYFVKAMALDRSFAPATRSASEKRVADLKALAVALECRT